MRISCVVAIAALAALGPQELAHAQLPAPPAIPDDIAQPQRDRLARQRRDALIQQSRLRDEARSHNAQCSAVTEGSAEDRACVERQQQLLDARARYEQHIGEIATAIRAAERAQAPPPFTMQRAAEPATAAPAPAMVVREPGEFRVAREGGSVAVRATGDYAITAPDGSPLTGDDLTRAMQEGHFRIKTGERGAAELTFDGYTRFRVQPNTEYIVRDENASLTSYELRVGAVEMVHDATARLQGRRRHRVKAGPVVGAPRGTRIDARVDAGGAGSMRVHEGSVDLFAGDTSRAIAVLTAGQHVTWDADLRITYLGALTRPVAPTRATHNTLGRRASAVWASTVSLGRNYGLIAAVLLLLALVTAQLVTNRRKTRRE